MLSFAFDFFHVAGKRAPDNSSRFRGELSVLLLLPDSCAVMSEDLQALELSVFLCHGRTAQRLQRLPHEQKYIETNVKSDALEY